MSTFKFPWTSQPQSPVGIDWGHPLSQCLHKVFVAGLPEAKSGTLPTNGLSLAATIDGVAVKNTSGTGVYEWSTNASPQTSAATVVIRAMRAGTQPDSGFGTALRLVQVSGTQDPFQLFIKDAGERIRWNTTTADNTNSVETTTNWPVGIWQTGAYVFSSGANAICYRNGVPQTLSLNTLGAKTGVLKPAISASINLSTLRFNGAVSLALVFSRALTPTEIKSISANPWQIFAPQSRQIWIPITAAGGAYTLAADTAAFALAGQAATLTYTPVGGPTHTLAADTAAFALAGQAAGLTTQRKVAADTAAFALAGQAAGLTTQRKVAADTAAFALAGQAAGLTYTPIGGPTYTLAAASASVALAGQETGLTAQRKLAVDTAAFALAGQATTLARGRIMPAASGDYAVVGNNAALLATRKLAAEDAALTLTGNAATLTYSGAEPPAVPGALVGDRKATLQLETRPARQQSGGRSSRQQAGSRPTR